MHECLHAGSAKLTKQNVNGAVNFAYEVNSEDLLFVISYFDIPAGMSLTFDSAIGAYNTARKAQVVSQKALTKDSYAGREAAMKLPDGKISRMQLVQAGRRWHSLIVEGSQEAAYGKDADKVFDSFKISE